MSTIYAVLWATLLSLSQSQITIEDGDTLTGTYDGVANGQLVFTFDLGETSTCVWDATGSSPNTNPTVGLLVSYDGGSTSDNDDQTTYPDEDTTTEFLMQMTIPAGTYDLYFEGSEGHDTYNYDVTLSM